MRETVITAKEANILKDLLEGWKLCTSHLDITGGNLIKDNVRLTWTHKTTQIEVTKQTHIPVKEWIPVK